VLQYVAMCCSNLVRFASAAAEAHHAAMSSELPAHLSHGPTSPAPPPPPPPPPPHPHLPASQQHYETRSSHSLQIPNVEVPTHRQSRFVTKRARHFHSTRRQHLSSECVARNQIAKSRGRVARLVHVSVLQCVAVCCVRCSALQCVARSQIARFRGRVSRLVHVSVLQYVAVCCSVLQYVAVRCNVLREAKSRDFMVETVAQCCSVLQCVAVRCSALQCVAVFMRSQRANSCYQVSRRVHVPVLHCVAVCCSVLQCAAVCSSHRDRHCVSLI